MLFKAAPSRLHTHCSKDSSRRKRQADEDQLQYLNRNFMTQGVDSGRDEIAQVLLDFLYVYRS